MEAKLRSNDTKFRPTGTKFPNEVSSHAAKFRFDSSRCLRNFAAFSSETKVRNLIAEIRVISLISANFVCISFAQYCTVALPLTFPCVIMIIFCSNYLTEGAHSL